MKDFIRKRSISFWIVVAILLIAIVLFCLGFRITYAPNLETSWSAVGAVAAWFSAIASFCAVIVAIQIPKKIADNQNRIALFDKRFEFYDTLQKCIAFSQLITNSSSSSKDIKMYFAAVFCDSSQNKVEEAVKDTLPLAIKASATLQKGEFLFDLNMKDEINALSMALIEITQALSETENAWSKYMTAAKTVETNIFPKVKAAVKLT